MSPKVGVLCIGAAWARRFFLPSTAFSSTAGISGAGISASSSSASPDEARPTTPSPASETAGSERDWRDKKELCKMIDLGKIADQPGGPGALRIGKKDTKEPWLEPNTGNKYERALQTTGSKVLCSFEFFFAVTVGSTHFRKVKFENGGHASLAQPRRIDRHSTDLLSIADKVATAFTRDIAEDPRKRTGDSLNNYGLNTQRWELISVNKRVSGPEVPTASPHLSPMPPPPMPPLTRQQTFGSLRSWWSDNNPNLRGPTINLHTAAKPLMKLMYDQQALEFVRNNRGIPLTSTAAEVYGSYLSCEYVSVSTKSAMLEDIFWRAHSDPEALVVQSNMFHDILKLFEVAVTMDTTMSETVWLVLRILALCETTAAETCGSLVALLFDSSVPQVVDRVLSLLSLLSKVPQIKFAPATSGVSVEAKLLGRLLDMLKDSSTTERHYQIMEILSDLACHEVHCNSSREGRRTKLLGKTSEISAHRPTPPNLLDVRELVHRRFASSSSKSIDDTIPIDALTRWWEGLVTAKLLDAPHKATAEATCSSLVAVLCYTAFIFAISDSLLRQVVDGALWALSDVPRLKFSPFITGVVSVEAKLLARLLDMLEDSSSTEPHHWRILQIISNLTLFESAAVAVVEANTLKYLEKPLRSLTLREETCWILGNLASHKSTASAVLNIHLYDLLATLWREDLHNIHPSTPALPLIELLARIARWREGAEGMVIVKLLNDVLEGLHSFNHRIRISTCRLLYELVGHKSTVQAVVEIVSREEIVALLT
ncbi:hypothetical protein C8J57DRAFT_1622380 [Mycena rebaudengoi]|nr:hypothetical protein C8J57DRAFT_1622380 [Mycena rebaudengoi]